MYVVTFHHQDYFIYFFIICFMLDLYHSNNSFSFLLCFFFSYFFSFFMKTDVLFHIMP